MKFNNFKSLVYKLLDHKVPQEQKISKLKQFPFIQPYKFLECSFDFWIVDEISQKWYPPEDRHSISELIAIKSLVQPGDKVLEIGSHHGFHTIFLSRLVGSSGYVLGIEASPFNAQVAQSQISLNELGNTCSVKNLACSDSNGFISLSMDSNASVVTNDDKNTIVVKTVTGDSLANDYGLEFNVLKIDVEGFEDQVLSGCEQILKLRPKLAIELHVPLLEKYQSTVESIFEKIDANNYRGVMIARSNKYESQPFDLHKIPHDIVNLVLSPVID